ncbi:MAG: hypothetical protein NZ480_04055 [Bdellovibrionaceae bacterium]|nr:hypothetical protein [Pseudobdellovibrionaceae bacterium]MDW8191158.1 hypothetical protein [Pseudobdellovibrionaceae bacterium]
MKNVALFLFLSLLVFVSYELNLRFRRKDMVSEAWNHMPREQGEDQRIVASAGPGGERGISWEKMLLKNIDGNRSAASVSEGKWDESQLTLAELVGNYRIVTQPNKKGRVFVTELEFVEDQGDLGKPLLLEDTWRFLQKNSLLFGLEELTAPNANSASTQISKDGQEIVELKSQDGRKAKVAINKDSKGRLLRLSVTHE